MKNERKIPSEVTVSLAEALHSQAIEDNPLTPREIERHKRFERDGLSVEDRLKRIRADIDEAKFAAE